MTGMPFDAWGPQAPSAGFADRVADAALRDLRAHAVEAPRRGRPWMILAIAASILVASAALAWTSRPAHVERLDPASTSRADPLPALRVRPLPVAPPPRLARPVVPPARPRAAASTPAPVAPPLPTTVRLPACRCNEYACDCGPE